MDTEEMYRRGAADAAQGEPHPFYYQHYYHYRRGYDQAQRRLRWSIGPAARRAVIWRLVLGVVLLAAIGYGIYAQLNRRPSSTQAVAAPVVLPTRQATVAVERTPIFPTATLEPSPTPPALRVGGRAQVTNTEGRPLRGREGASLSAPARVAFAQGEEVRLLEGPVDADGYTWWRIEGPSGTGWSAQQSPEGVVWLTPIAE